MPAATLPGEGEGFVILVAEDNEDDVVFLRHALTKAGLGKSVVFVRDGEEVIKYLTRQPPFEDPLLCPRPSLLLLDLRMPKIGGEGVLQWLRLHPEVGPLPVLVCTASLNPAERARALELGAGGCWDKPIRGDGWASMVEQIRRFGESRSRDEGLR